MKRLLLSRKLLFSPLLLCVILLSHTPGIQAQFSPPVSISDIVYSMDTPILHAVDLNGDGIMDLAVAGLNDRFSLAPSPRDPQDPGVQLYINQNGALQRIPLIIINSDTTLIHDFRDNIHFYDIDGDGIPDLFVTQFARINNSVRMFKGSLNAQGLPEYTFQQAWSLQHSADLQFADVTGNGMTDIIGNWGVMQRDPTSPILTYQLTRPNPDFFVSLLNYPGVGFRSFLQVADLDGNGFLDIVPFFSGNAYSLQPGNTTTVMPWAGFITADLDGDGRLDQIFPDGINFQEPDETFDTVLLPVPQNVRNLRSFMDLHIADFTGNGKQDVLLTERFVQFNNAQQTTFNALLYPNLGNRQFGAPIGLASGAWSAAAVLDYNANNKPDLVMMGSAGNPVAMPTGDFFVPQTDVYLNSVSGSFNPPPSPLNLQALSDIDLKGGVQLTYSLPDGLNPASYTVNVRVEDARTGAILHSGNARAGDGKLLVPAPGPWLAGQAIRFRDLDTQRTYRFRIQLIDHAYRASAFTSIDFTPTDRSFIRVQQLDSPDLFPVTATWARILPESQPFVIVSGENQNQSETHIFATDTTGILTPVAMPQIASLRGMRFLWTDLNGDGYPDLIQAGANPAGIQQVRAYLNRQGVLTPITIRTPLEPSAETVIRMEDILGVGTYQFVMVDPEFGLRVYTPQLYAEDNLLDFIERPAHPLTSIASHILDVIRTTDGDLGEPSFLVLQRDGTERILASYNLDPSGLRYKLHSSGMPEPFAGQPALELLHINTSGYADAVVRGVSGGTFHQLIIFETINQGEGPVKLEVHRTQSIRRLTHTLKDFNNNGFPDLLLAYADVNQRPYFSFFENKSNPNGRRTFIQNDEAVSDLPSLHSGFLLPMHLDSDGRSDLIIGGLNAAGVSQTIVYRNTTASDNQSPGQPALEAPFTVNGRTTFEWFPGFDDRTPNSAQLYAIAIGTRENVWDIRPAQATSSGKDLWAGASKLYNPVFSARLEPATTYYWTIQALDAAGMWSAQAPIQTYTVPVDPFTAAGPDNLVIRDGTIRFVDLNGDGRMDLLYSGRDAFLQPMSGAFLSVNQNNPVPAYDPLPLPGFQALGLAKLTFGDIDGDGAPDVVQMGLTASGLAKTVVYQTFRRGAGVSLVQVQELPGFFQGEARIFDADGDGAPDLLIAGLNEFQVPDLRWFRNTGRMPGSFAQNPFTQTENVFINPEGYMFASMDLADYNQDGLMDVVIAGTTLQRGVVIDLWQNQGGTFIRDVEASRSLPGSGEGQVRFADLNNDGLPDLVVTGREGTYAAIASKTPAGGIQYTVTYLPQIPGLLQSRLAVGDLDHNGTLDLIVSGRINQGGGFADPSGFWMFQNDGEGNFSAAPASWSDAFPALYNGSIELGDATGNGAMDVLLAGAVSQAAQPLLYVNRLTASSDGQIPANTAPSPPARPTIIAQNGQQYLSWGPAQDDHTPPAAMRYNVRLSENNTSDTVVRSGSTLPDGVLQYYHGGNAGNATIFPIPNGLDPQTEYQWEVQSIDQSGIASSFIRGPGIHTPGQSAAELHIIRENGPREFRINLVFLAEGYTAAEKNVFVQEATRITDSLFVFSPYKEYASYFNVYAISVPSNDPLISSGRVHQGQVIVEQRDTYFNAFRNNFNNAAFITIPDADTNSVRVQQPGYTYQGSYADGFGKVDALLAALMPDYDLIMMLCKTDAPAGSASLWQDRTIAFVGTGNFAGSQTRFQVARHELAHSFGLGDEYDFAISGMIGHPQNNHPNTVFLGNVAGQPREAIIPRIPWAHWIPEQQSVITPPPFAGATIEVGVFAGAQYANQNWYRAHANDLMRSAFSLDSKFGPVNREWLIKSFYGYRWHVPGMREPYHRLRPIRPVQWHTPNDDVLSIDDANPLSLSIIHPVPNHAGGLEITWRINGSVAARGTSSLTKNAHELGAGVHTISLLARDLTPFSEEQPNERHIAAGQRRWVIPESDSLGYLTETISWIIQVNTEVSVAASGDNPSTFSLNQNYPNPFNPSTRITYTLASAAQVNISVYNTLGQRIATLISEYQSLGTHSVEFNGQQLPSGVYFYEVQVGQERIRRKMMLLK